jgi:hypothetical protein
MDTLTAEWKPKGRIYLVEVESNKRNRSVFSAPTWVRDDNTLVQWLKDRIADKTLLAFDEVRIVKPITDVVVKLS